MMNRMFLFLPFDIIIIKENSDVHFEYENLPHTFFGTIQILYNFYNVIITLTISQWLDKNMRFFLDRTWWILFKPSISAKINLDRSRGASGTI